MYNSRINDGTSVPAPVRRFAQVKLIARTALLLLVVAAIHSIAPARAFGQEEVRIVGIEVEGNTSIPDTAVLQHVRSSPARATNAQQIREDTRKLYSTRWFSSVEHSYRQTERGSVLVFHVQERPIVRKVEYIGNRKIKRSLLDSWTGLRVGSPMDPSANKEAAKQIKRRYEEKGFRHAEVSLEQGGTAGDQAVVFRINEGPKVYVYRRVFSGNKFVSGARLKTKLSTKAAVLGLPVMSLGLFNPDTIPNDVESLKQYYHALGFFDAKITATPKSSADKAWVTVFFSVDEGVRYKVRSIEYSGSGAIASKQLSKGRELKEGDFFNARFMNKDVGNMLTQYDERGRYFARVQPDPRFFKEPGVVDLVYEIDEDRVRILRNINVNLVAEHSNTKESVILDRSPMAPGDIVSRMRERRFRGNLLSSGVFEPGPGGVRLEVVPVEGAQALAARRRNSSVMRGQNADRMPSKPGFGHTVGANRWPARTDKPVVGNPFYKPKYFQEPATTKTIFRGQSPEPAFRSGVPAPIFRGQGPEFRGQNFEPANPIYDNMPQGDPLGRQLTDPGFVDINVFANEGRTGRLMFGGGINSDAGLVGSFAYDEQNFNLFRPPTSWADIVDGRAWRGGGQRLRLEAMPGDQVSRYSASWTNPYFLHSDYSFSVNGFFFNRFFPDWDERRGGGRISIGKQVSPEMSISAAVRLEEVRLKDPSGTPPPQVLLDSVGSNFLSTGQVAMTYDTRDSSILPSEGYYAQLSYEQAFGDFTYPRFEGEYRQFWTLTSRPDGSGRHVFSVVGQLGWTGDDTPIYERFFAGGAQSFRGFAFRGIGPVENSVSIGGRWMAIGSAEYRMPLVASDAVHGVLFTDFGTVEDNVTFDNFRVTVGAGLRVTIKQMGSVPLAFDFGFPVVKQDFDDERIFNFTVSANR